MIIQDLIARVEKLEDEVAELRRQVKAPRTAAKSESKD